MVNCETCHNQTLNKLEIYVIMDLIIPSTWLFVEPVLNHWACEEVHSVLYEGCYFKVKIIGLIIMLYMHDS